MRKLVVLQIVLAVVALIVTSWVFFKARPKVEEKQQLEDKLAVAEQKNQKLESAVIVVQSDRKQSRLHLRQGVTLFHQQKYDEAIAQYDKALEVFPDDPYGWSLKGYALFKAGNIPQSIEANQKAVQLDPGDPLNFIDLAKSYCAQKQYDEALRVLVDEPSPDVFVDIRRYLQTDGEIRRLCKPILARISKQPPQPKS